MFTTTQAAPPAPAGDLFHGLPAGVDAACPCRPCRRARNRIADALETVKYGVPRYRALRRVQALAAIGYPPETLAGILGCPAWELHGMMDARLSGHPSRRLFARLFAAYETLSARPLLETADPRWPAPLAWGETDEPGGIDDPDARPVHDDHDDTDSERYHDSVDHARVERVLAGDTSVPTTRAEKEAVTARWIKAGRSWASLERLTGWNVECYTPEKVAAREAAEEAEKAGTAA